jgi:transcriptional regulator with XRE-family HTH domain
MNNVFRRENEHFVQPVNTNVNEIEKIVQRLAMVQAALRLRTKEQLAGRLGIGRTTLYYVETGEHTPGKQFLQTLQQLEQEAGLISEQIIQEPRQITPRGADEPTRLIAVLGWAHAGEAAARIGGGYYLCRVLGWAHAGEAAGYDELPKSWQKQIPTECPDVKAFAVRLEGDSMEPRFAQGDVIICQPSVEPYSGCYVVARFKDDGVIFRRLEMSGKTIRLVPLNERYPVTSHNAEEFSWIYPVWARITQLWKR